MIFATMHFSHLHLTHFRNYAGLSLELSPGINVITGNNGEGKTNILEAVHYLSMTRGWHSKTEKYALKEDEQYFIVEGYLEDTDGRHNVQCNYLPPKGKKMILDKRPLQKMSDHIGRIPSVAVLPSDTQLIDGGPGVRRKFMDSLICQYSQEYLQKLIAYEHALMQRNALLTLMGERRKWDPEQLQLWSAQLIEPGIFILEKRRQFLAKFLPAFLEYFRWIVSDKETPTITLESQFVENNAAEWQARFKSDEDRDRYSQRTNSGIHKDDLVLQIDGQGVKNYGSQGQQKTFVIALKMAQYALLGEEKGLAPLLLLDDIFDKLDMHRLRAIARMLDERVKGQVLITDTSLERCASVFSEVKTREIKYFYVAAATVKPAPLNGNA
ncbi:MAG: DNA replication/repair protein RecF [Bacteroidetes bacterium]|nr:DNA replication/repair protein RecF [Bacteroidota bacterium]